MILTLSISLMLRLTIILLVVNLWLENLELECLHEFNINIAIIRFASADKVFFDIRISASYAGVGKVFTTWRLITFNGCIK
jgi:hypothetical protein